jgi:hypothetical protein
VPLEARRNGFGTINALNPRRTWPSRAFEVCDPVISGDRLSSMGRSTAGHGHPRVLLIASECNHRGRASRDAIACRCADRLWRY